MGESIGRCRVETNFPCRNTLRGISNEGEEREAAERKRNAGCSSTRSERGCSGGRRDGTE